MSMKSGDIKGTIGVTRRALLGLSTAWLGNSALVKNLDAQSVNASWLADVDTVLHAAIAA
jgi:hypothetical protein